MPLEILLALVVGGISAIALLLHATGRSSKACLDHETARVAWHRQFPETQVRQVLPAENRHAALILTEEGTGLVWSFGADTVARFLVDFDLLSTKAGLKVEFHDFATPGVALSLSANETRRWQQLMTAP